MKMTNNLHLIIAAYLFSCSLVSADEPAWSRDFQTAEAKAKSEGRSLFILFTGHGWCHACEIVDREVFQTERFVNATKRKYVFVELDFNFGDGSGEQERKSRLMQLRSRYLAPTVPTVVLADVDGRPYAYITDYESGTGPEKFLDLLASAERAREKRDERLRAAAESSGITRAKLLDDALSAVSPLLGEIGERGDDPLLQFYKGTVRDILELTDDTEPIAKKYVARQQRRDEWFASESVFARLNDFSAKKDYAGAINYIDSCLESTTSESIRWRLEYSRQVYLEWSDRNAEALENCRRLLATDEISDEHREQLLDREAYNLFRLDRIEDGLKHYDQRIADAADDQVKRLRLLGWKAQMMNGRDPVSASIAALEAYRKETERGTDDWRTATSLLAREFQRANSHKQALKLMEEFLSEDRVSWVMLDAAESYLALGNFNKCRRFIEETTKSNNNLEGSDRQSEREEFAAVADRIKDLKQKLDNATSNPKDTEPTDEREPL